MSFESELSHARETALYFLLAGPAGSGKTTLCNRIVESSKPDIQRVITATSRMPRPSEINGVDYYFFSNEEFFHKINENSFYEYALVHGRYYGSLKSEINGKLEAGINLIAAIDVQGVAQMKAAEKKDAFLKNRLITIFIMPRSMDQLKERLKFRGTDDEMEINLRLKTAEQEIEYWKSYDYCIISDTRNHDYACLNSIIEAEKMRVRLA